MPFRLFYTFLQRKRVKAQRKAELLTCAIKALGDGVKKGVLRGQEPFHHWHDDKSSDLHRTQNKKEKREREKVEGSEVR